MDERWTLTEVVGAQVEALSLDEAKVHLRVDATTDDATITSMIAAARRWVERAGCGRQISVATLQLTLDEWPVGTYQEIELPNPPVHSISAVTYVDVNGVTQTLAASEYTLDNLTEPCRLRPSYSNSWPSARDDMGVINVTYVAGYVTKSTVNATTDILTWLGRTPVAGEAVTLSNSGGALPGGLATMTTYYVRDVTGSTCKLAATLTGNAIDITSTGTGTHFIGVVPETIMQAMKLLLGHLYEHREAYSDGQVFDVPFALDSLLMPERVNFKGM